MACRGKNRECVKGLLEAGANPALVLPDSSSAIKCAKEIRDTECLRMLLGALRTGQDLKGHTVTVLASPYTFPRDLADMQGKVSDFDATKGLCVVEIHMGLPAGWRKHLLPPSVLRRVDAHLQADVGAVGVPAVAPVAT